MNQVIARSRRKVVFGPLPSGLRSQLTSPAFRGTLTRRDCFSAAHYWQGWGTAHALTRPMSRPEPMANDLYPLPHPLPPPDLASILEHHLATSLPPDLAFDLVLNELVVRAADATHASSASLALWNGNEMVCRAATGRSAPGLGVPLILEMVLSPPACGLTCLSCATMPSPILGSIPTP